MTPEKMIVLATLIGAVAGYAGGLHQWRRTFQEWGFIEATPGAAIGAAVFFLVAITTRFLLS